MSEQSIWCTKCEHYWRPDRMARINTTKRAPDGGPSGHCKACRNELYRASYERIRADPERWTARQALRATYHQRKYWSMTPEERHADAVRRSGPQRAYRLRRVLRRAAVRGTRSGAAGCRES